jgi:hypothetical protein
MSLRKNIYPAKMLSLHKFIEIRYQEISYILITGFELFRMSIRLPWQPDRQSL